MSSHPDFKLEQAQAAGSAKTLTHAGDRATEDVGIVSARQRLCLRWIFARLTPFSGHNSRDRHDAQYDFDGHNVWKTLAESILLDMANDVPEVSPNVRQRVLMVASQYVWRRSGEGSDASRLALGAWQAWASAVAIVFAVGTGMWFTSAPTSLMSPPVRHMVAAAPAWSTGHAVGRAFGGSSSSLAAGSVAPKLRVTLPPRTPDSVKMSLFVHGVEWERQLAEVLSGDITPVGAIRSEI